MMLGPPFSVAYSWDFEKPDPMSDRVNRCDDQK